MNEPVLLKPFCDYVAHIIDERGVYPCPSMYVTRAGETTVGALALDANQVLDFVWQQITCEQAQEVIFGLDRATRPGQGTEFADVLTCAHWHPSFDKSWNAAWRPFVINYQHAPRIVRPADFENWFWNQQIRRELAWHCPPIRVRTETK